MPSVYIVGNKLKYGDMFKNMGWSIVEEPSMANLIQFTGGEDVTPSLYGESKHSKTNNNPQRDAREAAIFKIAHGWNIPMAGICRGGQFLNVMCGGKLYQDVDGHAIPDTHKAVDEDTGKAIQVTSTHHQMMIPGPLGEVTLTANRAKKVSVMRYNKECTVFRHKFSDKDTEAVHYPNYNVFCFQPHPEYTGHDSLASYYFNCLHKYLGSKGN